MKMVFDEWYGELSYAQRAAYRKYNVSPSDHNDLVSRYGQGSHAEITAAVKRFSRDGMFSTFDMWRNNVRP
jgi:hypothetical protein